MTTAMRHLPIRRQGVSLSDEETRSVLLDPRRNVSYMLNPSARAIWDLCDGRTSLDEVVAAICQVFSVSPRVALHDVTAVLAELEDAGLVSWSSDAGEEQ